MSKTPSNRHNVIAATKNAEKPPKTPPTAPPPNPPQQKVEYHSLLHNWMSTTLAMKRSEALPLYNRRCMITGTFTTVDELRHRPWAPVVAHNGHATTVQINTSCNCGISTVSHDCARTCWTCTKSIDHLVNVLQLENLDGRPRESASAPRQGCRRTPRLCMITGTSTTAGTAPAAPPCTCRRTTGMSPPCLRTAPSSTCRRNNGPVNTLSENCNCRTPRAALSGPKSLSYIITGKTTTLSLTGEAHVDDMHNRDIDHHNDEEEHETQQNAATRPAPPQPPRPSHRPSHLPFLDGATHKPHVHGPARRRSP